MSEKIKMSYTVAVAGGPSIAENRSADIEAIDWLKIKVPQGAQDFELNVQPGETGEVELFVVSAASYAPGVTYSLNTAEADAAKRKKLDAALLLLGEGAVHLLGASPKKLYFYNDGAEDVEVKILVGRKAVTVPPPPAPPAPAPPPGS